MTLANWPDRTSARYDTVMIKADHQLLSWMHHKPFFPFSKVENKVVPTGVLWRFKLFWLTDVPTGTWRRYLLLHVWSHSALQWCWPKHKNATINAYKFHICPQFDEHHLPKEQFLWPLNLKRIKKLSLFLLSNQYSAKDSECGTLRLHNSRNNMHLESFLLHPF